MKKRIAYGCMTGTSLDGLDVAAIEVVGDGLNCTCRFLAGESHSLATVQQRLRMLADQAPMSAGEITRLANDFVQLHVAALRELQKKSELRPDVIAVHGQTVFHAPPLSWQLCTPAPIAAALRAPVVFDLRAADLAAGGQGAPITPLADYIFFRASNESRAIINLGGFCNFTFLPATGSKPEPDLSQIRGGDVCACNHLLNQIARTVLNAEYDRDGAQAQRGQIEEVALRELMSVLGRQAAAGRSLGTGDEIGGWVVRHQAGIAGTSLARTACEAIGAIIGKAVSAADRVVLAGGGVRNRTLIDAIIRYCGRPGLTTGELGWPVEYREACAMAILGVLCQDRVPITLPQITRVPAPAPVAGIWMYPG